MSATSAETGWRERYLGVAAWLADRAPAAAPVLTGANACVDAVFQVDAERLAKLVAVTRDGAGAGAGGTGDDAPGLALVRRILSRIGSGHGGELLTRWPGGPAWITRLLGEPDRRQVGGTGPQASWALATLGAPSVLALADRSAAQLAVIDPRTDLVADGRTVPAGAVGPHGAPTKAEHCILEFRAGTPFAAGVLPRSTRLILRFGDEALERDEQYAALTPRLAPRLRAGLLSGLNGLPYADHPDAAWLAALARSWADAGLPVIHHELAEFPDAERLRQAPGALAANSLGMSLSELHLLAGRVADPRPAARDLAEQHGVRRVIVHADDWSMAVHAEPFQRQDEILLAGNATAAARAATGRPAPTLDPAEDARYTDDLPASGPLGGGWFATAVPSPYLARPAATIGLGDTFVAGVLLAHSLP